MVESRPATVYVATASGGLWKTINNGVTWTPVFDSQDSYSIGTVVLDPKDSSVVWAGTGENNNQRSVNYGDGVYGGMFIAAMYTQAFFAKVSDLFSCLA